VIAGTYDATCGGCPLPGAVDPDPAEDPAATPAAEEDAAPTAATADVLPFPAGTGVADAALGRERRLAAGLREFEGRDGTAAEAVEAYAAGAEVGCWCEITERERRDSVGDPARSGL